MQANTKGIAALEAKLKAIPPSIREATKKANDKNADEFIQHIEAIIPREDGELVATLAKTQAPLDGVRVSIGGPEAPYPAHLEWGHMTKGGKHVPGEPFWFPTLRVMRKRFRARRTRAATNAIKAFVASGGGSPSD